MRSFVRASMWTTAGVVALVSTGTAAAQDAAGTASGRILEEVVVTAQKRSESLQDVPLAVTTISGDVLANSGVNVVQNLSRLTPGLEVNRYAQFVSLFLRGVGTRFANLGLEPTVGLYFDDLYSARSTVGMLDFVDVDHIEVLKGPQGTLYGRNTTAGAIRVITKDPTDEFGGSAAVTFGRYERQRFDGVINVPLTSTLSSRFAVTYDTDDGFVDTNAPGMPQLEDRQSFMGTGKLLWTPTDELTVKLAGSVGHKRDRAGLAFINLYDDVRETGVAVGGAASDDFYTSTQNFAQDDDLGKMLTDTNSLELRADLDLGSVVLSSISGYRYFKNTGAADLDATDVSFQNAVTHFENGKVWSQEFQAVSNGSGPLSWLGGLYLYQEKDRNTFIVFGQALGPQVSDYQDPTGLRQLNTDGEVKIESAAPYAQATYAFTDQFSLTLGGRYSWERKKMPYHVSDRLNFAPAPIRFVDEPSQKLTSEKFTPKITFEYRPNADLLFYAGWSRGFKSGGFNLPAPGAPADQLDPETLDSYEIGWKTEFDRMRFNGAAFYYDYKDIQIGRSDPVRGSSVVQNAAKAELYGIESELLFAVGQRLELGVGATWLHSEFKSFIGDILAPNFNSAACAAAGNVPASPACRGFRSVPNVDLSGEELPLAPTFSGNLRANFSQPLSGDAGELALSSVLSYAGKFNWGPGSTYQSEPEKYLLSAQVTWTSSSEKLSVGVFGDNLLEEKYRTNVTANTNGGYYTPGAPLTWGVRAGVKF